MPIVQPRPFDLAAIQGKAKRLDQVKKSARPQAGATDITRIPVNLRRHQYHVPLRYVEARFALPEHLL